MPKGTEDVNKMPAAATTLAIARMLTLEQVQQIQNVKASLVHSLVPAASCLPGNLVAAAILSNFCRLGDPAPR